MLVLASQSPRRKQLLEQLDIPFAIEKSNVNEELQPCLTPAEQAIALAEKKANDIWKKRPDHVVLGADTIVVIEDKILGKPKSAKEAFTMLSLLSGRTHEVITGVAIVARDNSISFYEKTLVTFWELSNEEIEAYIASKEPFDKAGAYGIQELGSYLVKEIHGDYFNVVGLPISAVARKLKEFGIRCF